MKTFRMIIACLAVIGSLFPSCLGAWSDAYEDFNSSLMRYMGEMNQRSGNQSVKAFTRELEEALKSGQIDEVFAVLTTPADDVLVDAIRQGLLFYYFSDEAVISPHITKDLFVLPCSPLSHYSTWPADDCSVEAAGEKLFIVSWFSKTWELRKELEEGGSLNNSLFWEKSADYVEYLSKQNRTQDKVSESNLKGISWLLGLAVGEVYQNQEQTGTTEHTALSRTQVSMERFIYRCGNFDISGYDGELYRGKGIEEELAQVAPAVADMLLAKNDVDDEDLLVQTEQLSFWIAETLSLSDDEIRARALAPREARLALIMNAAEDNDRWGGLSKKLWANPVSRFQSLLLLCLNSPFPETEIVARELSEELLISLASVLNRQDITNVEEGL